MYKMVEVKTKNWTFKNKTFVDRLVFVRNDGLNSG